MTIPAIARLLVVLGRLAGLAGAALTVGAVVAMVGVWAYSAVRHAPDWNVGLLPVVLPLQALVAGWVAWSTLVAKPRPLLRKLLIAAAVSFLAFYGWYFMLLGGGMGAIAYGNILYLLAGLFVAVAAMSASALGDSRVPSASAREPALGGDPAGSGPNAMRSARALGAVGFLAVAAATGYAVASTTAEEAGSDPTRDDLPTLSCPDHLGKEVASFGGSGGQVSREFEVESMWGYEYKSWGYGALQMTLVDEGGDAPYDEQDAPPVPVGSTGGGEYASGGAYRLEIAADEEANYEVLICDGPSTREGA